MPTVDTKRKPGRPSKETSDMPSVQEPATDPREAWKPQAYKPAGPECPYCGKNTERSTMLLRAYGLVALRCIKCERAAIEGDVNWYELKTAASGLLMRRAATIYEQKYPTRPMPVVKGDGLSDAMMADEGDPRWVSESF